MDGGEQISIFNFQDDPRLSIMDLVNISMRIWWECEEEKRLTRRGKKHRKPWVDEAQRRRDLRRLQEIKRQRGYHWPRAS